MRPFALAPDPGKHIQTAHAWHRDIQQELQDRNRNSPNPLPKEREKSPAGLAEIRHDTAESSGTCCMGFVLAVTWTSVRRSCRGRLIEVICAAKPSARPRELAAAF